MNIHFQKYQGTGNDFVLIDNRNGFLNPQNFTEKEIAFLCHRRFGIGADGLMLVEKSVDYDFEMKYYNSDGRIGSMCGNGGRCIVAFAKKIGAFAENQTKFIASDGEHEALVTEENGTVSVNLKMQNVNSVSIHKNYTFLDTGSPHHIEFVENVDQVDVYNKGKSIRYNAELYEKGTNVNFVEQNGNQIKVRTYERGVEDETYSCGTGVVASSISSYIKQSNLKNEFFIGTKGGDLKVSFSPKGNNSFENIWLEGPATFVFEGQIEL